MLNQTTGTCSCDRNSGRCGCCIDSYYIPVSQEWKQSWGLLVIEAARVMLPRWLTRVSCSGCPVDPRLLPSTEYSTESIILKQHVVSTGLSDPTEWHSPPLNPGGWNDFSDSRQASQASILSFYWAEDHRRRRSHVHRLHVRALLLLTCGSIRSRHLYESHRRCLTL